MEQVCDLEQKLQDLDKELESSKALDGSLQKYLAGSCVTCIYNRV